ncbi:MAG: ABC-2 transporter permease, partial [Acetivibrio ethanolgignens]
DFIANELFLSCFTSISIGLVGFFILLPITFHFGVEKARYIMFLLFMIPFLLVLAVARFGLLAHISLDKISDTVISRYLLLGETGLLIFTLLMSLPLSLWIVNRKEY